MPSISVWLKHRYVKRSSENFIPSFKCLNVYSVLGVVLGTEDTAVGKTDMVPVLTAYKLNATQVHCLDYVLPQIVGHRF